MKVKIGNKIYSSDEQPIMILFEDFDRENIGNMNPECTKYCSFPAGMDTEKIKEWMR